VQCAPVHSVFDVKLFAIMPQFVIEREVPGAGALTEAQIRDLSLRSLQTLKEMGPRIQWLHSYVTEDKVYCVYLAPDEDTVREHARKVGIPADRVSAVRRMINPLDFV
jgi:Nickel responsive protein SCO4226-like